MAKRASLTSGLSGLASQKPASVPAVSKGNPAEAKGTELIHDPRQGDIEQAAKRAKTGRPRTLPDGVKTLSVRVSRDVQKALRQAALDHDIPMQEIIMNGIMDQLAKLAR
ncbi:hypothetical protein [Acetobacter sp.]|uniref:hypothetical protein n=1 Tax=Acetobacter sp. TaxID=440 RepID=UPI0039EAA56E